MSDPSEPKQDEEQPEFTPEQLARAEKHQYILYGVMILFLVLPFIVFFFTGKLGGE